MPLIFKAKMQQIRARQIKAITYKATITDDMHILNFTNENIKKKNPGRAGWNYACKADRDIRNDAA